MLPQGIFQRAAFQQQNKKRTIHDINMNAHALLTSQGWLGTGHALDSRLEPYYGPTYNQKGKRGLAYDPSEINAQATTANGLVKPLLISQRHGSRYGIGKKAHEPQSGNQWWLKGFQSALDNIGKSESERTSGTSTPVNGDGYGGKHGGLYGYFIKGQLMSGTIGQDEADSDGDSNGKKKSKKRKSDALDEEPEKDPLTVSPVKRPQTSQELEASIPYLQERDKSRRPVHTRAQSTDQEQFTVMSEFLSATTAATEKKKKKNRKSRELETEDVDESGSMGEQIGSDHRTSRKKQKEEKKQFKLLLAQMVQEEMEKLSSMEDTSDHQDEADGTRKPHKSKTKRRLQVAAA